MTCPRCGKPASGETRRCAHCGAGLAHASITTGVVIAVDTTGLPPGATFGPSDPSTAGTGEAATGAPGVGPIDHDGPLQVGQSFSPRYHIIKLLGIGGMGAVYQAWDAELGVAVALKVIRADTRHRAGASEAEKRFKQELLLARQVTHKHVVRIHDISEIDGIKFITMPFVKGEDLSTLLRRELKLPVSRALRLARQIAAGMQAAHDAGVVHRDLKPPNIMISGAGASADDGEQALIMDFGISASAEEDSSGTIIGTLEYMAPEQAAGKSVDARADIYAFGLILYECLLGLRLTKEVLTPAARVEAMKYRVAEGVVPLRTVDRTIPAPLEAIVMRCLDREPAARFQTTAALVAALAELDANGNRLPIVRRLTKPMMAAAAAVVAVMVVGTYYTAKWLTAPVKQPDPVALVIADFRNTTGETQFDRTLEIQIKRALEGAGFISAYDHGGIKAAFGVTPPATFDENGAREFAGKQGVAIVVSGSVERDGSGYSVSLKAMETVSGKVIATAKGRAPGRDRVLAAAMDLAPPVRRALGDKSKSDQMFAPSTTVSAISTDVLRQYAAAREASSAGNFDEAKRNYLKALELDPQFGIAYQGLAMLSYNDGNHQDAGKYVKQALRYLDGMTERERYTTRGTFYMATDDYQQCVKEYIDLSVRFPAELVAHNNLALCLTHLRDWPRAIEEQKRAVQMVPTRALFRTNLALYADYGSDFQAGEREAREVLKSNKLGLLPLAFAQTGQGQIEQASETYAEFEKASAFGATLGSAGRGDLAAVQGRFADAARILEQGAVADLAHKNNDRAAAKLVALAYVRTLKRQNALAVAAADKALATSQLPKVTFLAGRTFVRTGDAAKTRALIKTLGSQLQIESQASAKILEGDLALANGDNAQAAKLFAEANAVVNTWIGHFDLGRAYFAAGSLVQADSEFDWCIKRRGEALALFLDEDPTYAFFPEAYYYQGRVRESLNTQGFADSYRAYLDLRGQSNEDPVVPDVRRRVTSR